MYTEVEEKSFLPIFHKDYAPPTPELINKVIVNLGFNQIQIAKLTGVSFTEKGSSSVRRWKVEQTDKTYRKIDSSKWRLLVEVAGLSTTQATIDALTL